LRRHEQAAVANVRRTKFPLAEIFRARVIRSADAGSLYRVQARFIAVAAREMQRGHASALISEARKAVPLALCAQIAMVHRK
jgi:hypothetical protein